MHEHVEKGNDIPYDAERHPDNTQTHGNFYSKSQRCCHEFDKATRPPSVRHISIQTAILENRSAKLDNPTGMAG